MNTAMSTVTSTATSLIKTKKTPTTQPPHPKRSKAVTPVVSIDQLQRSMWQTVTLQGWLYRHTGKGKLQFLQVRDGTGICQVVVFRGNVGDEQFDAGKQLTQESSLKVTGVVKAEPRPLRSGGASWTCSNSSLSKLRIHTPSRPREHGIEALMSHRHLWLRSSRQWAAMRRAVIIRSIRDRLDDHGYLNVDTPIPRPPYGGHYHAVRDRLPRRTGRRPRPANSTTRPTSSPRQGLLLRPTFRREE